MLGGPGTVVQIPILPKPKVGITPLAGDTL